MNLDCFNRPDAVCMLLASLWQRLLEIRSRTLGVCVCVWCVFACESGCVSEVYALPSRLYILVYIL